MQRHPDTSDPAPRFGAGTAATLLRRDALRLRMVEGRERVDASLALMRVADVVSPGPYGDACGVRRNPRRLRGHERGETRDVRRRLRRAGEKRAVEAGAAER